MCLSRKLLTHRARFLGHSVCFVLILLNLTFSLNCSPAFTSNNQVSLSSSESVKAPVVAVIDSGLNIEHPVFKHTQSVWENPGEVCKTCQDNVDDDENGYVDDYNGWNFIPRKGNNDVMDEDGHGTIVSGIVLRTFLGISEEEDKPSFRLSDNYGQPRIHILPLKVVSKVANNKEISPILFYKAIDYAIRAKVDIINISYGYFPKFIFESIEIASKEGILTVLGAGNDKKNRDIHRSGYYEYLRRFNNPVPRTLVMVAALDTSLNTHFLNSSSDTYSPVLWDFSDYGSKTVHIAAPGKHSLSTCLSENDCCFGNASCTLVDGKRFLCQRATGTSVAAPVVSGLGARIFSMDPNLESDDDLVRELTEENNISTEDLLVSLKLTGNKVKDIIFGLSDVKKNLEKILITGATVNIKRVYDLDSMKIKKSIIQSIKQSISIEQSIKDNGQKSLPSTSPYFGSDKYKSSLFIYILVFLLASLVSFLILQFTSKEKKNN